MFVCRSLVQTHSWPRSTQPPAPTHHCSSRSLGSRARMASGPGLTPKAELNLGRKPRLAHWKAVGRLVPEGWAMCAQPPDP